MTVVKIADLKNRLSHYLRLVKQGEPVLIKDRDTVIARIEPVSSPEAELSSEGQRLARLRARGALKPSATPLTAPLMARFLASRPTLDADLLEALLAERNEGR